MSDNLSLPVSSFFSVSESGNGLIYPLFRAQTGNVPFVQIIDRHGIVESFAPLFETDGLNFFPACDEFEVSVGESALVAVELAGVIVADTIAGFRSRAASGEIDLNDPSLPPLTRLGLSRLIDDSVMRRSAALANFLQSTVLSDQSIDHALASEARAQLSLKTWWTQIEDAEVAGKRDLPKSLEVLDIEEAFHWLIDNDIDENWKKLFLSIITKVLFDVRVNTLLSMFVSEYDDLFSYDKTSKILLSRGIEIFTSFGYFDQEFFDRNLMEFLYEKVINGQIFLLSDVIDPSSLIEFLDRLPDSFEDYDRDSIVDSIIDYLESSIASPGLSRMLFDYLWNNYDLEEEYPENSAYSGSRYDRIFNSYLTDGLFKSKLPKYIEIEFKELKASLEKRARD